VTRADHAPRTIAVVGATATGKTALGEALADALDGEVVCCDSRQVFRELDLGTGKPSAAERGRRPHHLFDALALGERASAGWYGRAATGAREAIAARGRTAVLVGGSGLYLKAAQEGLADEPPHDAGLRAQLRAALQSEGPEALHRRLAELDPGGAARVAPRDHQRIRRALEVVISSGKPLSWWHERSKRPAQAEPWIVLELVEEPARLRARIAERTRWMWSQGLVDEVRALVDAGRGESLRALRAIGYDEVLDQLEGRRSPEQAQARVDQRTAQLAKRQRTWFRHQVESLRLDASLDPDALRARALQAVRATAAAR